jgi:hypothetical protein
MSRRSTKFTEQRWLKKRKGFENLAGVHMFRVHRSGLRGRK